MAQFTFDATQYNPEAGIGQLSVGRHMVIIEKDEIKKANGSNGGYLQLDLKGVNQSQGESGAYRLNLFAAGENAQKTIEIASRQLSAVCHAVGIPGLNGDTSVLFGLPFMVEVAYQKGHNPATDGSDAKGYTEIKRVYYADGTDIKPGVFGSQGSQGNQQQSNGFGQQQQTNTNANQGNNNGGGFGNQNQNQNQNQNNQPQDNTQQQGNNGGGQVQFGQTNHGNQQQSNNNGQQQQGGWKPGQGNDNTGNGQTWQPRQN